LPDHARQRLTWADLGRDGTLRQAFRAPDPRYGYDPVSVRELLTGLDAWAGVGTTLSVCVQVATALPLLLGTQKSVAGQALDGDVQLAFAATDCAAAGSDLTGLGSTVRSVDGGLELTGAKRWIVNATTAEKALVLARHAPGRQFTSFTLLLVDLNQQGVLRQAADTAAFDGSGVGDLVFDRVRLDNSAVLGGRGRGLALFVRQLAGERLASGLWAQAMTARVLADTVTYLRNRPIAEGVLWDNPAVRHRVVELVLAHQRLRALADQLCRPSSEPAAMQTSIAHSAVIKAAGARTLEHVLGECAQLMGADGFQRGSIQDLRREAAMFGIAGGSTPTMYDLIADHIDELLPVRESLAVA
jgi:citronellyl-CoA dehydrogenase